MRISDWSSDVCSSDLERDLVVVFGKSALAEKVPFDKAKREEMPEKFLLYSRHVNEHVVALDNGDLMLMLELDGRPFETSDVRDLNDWHPRLNGVWRNIHDERLSIWRSDANTSDVQSIKRITSTFFFL